MSVGSPPSREVFPPEFEEMWGSPLARRAVRRGRRLRRSVRRRPLLLDAVLALLLLTSGLVAPHHTGSGQTAVETPTAALVLTVLGQSLPVVWRRRAPMAVLAVVLAASVVQWAWWGESQRSVTGLLIAIYSLARYERLDRLLWPAPFLFAGLTVSAFRVKPFEQQPLYSLFFLCATSVAAAALALVVRVRRAQLGALADRAHRLEVEREQRVQLATLAERSRVSREMHDIIGHNLAVIIGLADGAGAAAANDPARGAEVLPVIAGTARQALSELRRTLSALSERADQPLAADQLAPQPGLADLAPLLERIQAAGPRISHRTAGDLDALPPGVQLTVYRIVQEALTNSLKHAGPATGVQVVLRVGDQQVDVRVQDTGRPDGAPARPGSGLADADQEGQGLVGIHERAALAGGTAVIGPTGDGGWLVHAVLPLDRKPAPQSSPNPATEEDRP
ncbi:signal transduction histidine kinase [Streptomyces sp. 846.5]|nr:histidine kinase [Streptomyces sp. 846.5]TDT98022.1 signal transduction histidine kinase [Streptomyces sp. 846.5]